MAQKNNFLSFNSGIVNIYSVENIAEKGDKPDLQLKHKWKLRFEYQKIGVQRFYIAQQNDVKLSQLVRIPQRLDINTHDVAIINSIQFDIVQVQHSYDSKPLTTLLSLEELISKYDTTRI